MSSPTSPSASPACVDEAPIRMAEILSAYHQRAAHITNRPKLPMPLSLQEQRADQAAVGEELADLQREMLEDLQRLEQAFDLAVADERERLEAAILPVLSADPQVQRVFELRQVKALARFTPLLNRADTEAAIDATVRQLADEAARQSDWATLSVLRMHTAPALTGRGIDPSTSEALQIIERTVLAVRPRAAPALAERRELELGAAEVASAFVRARAAVEGSEQAVQLSGPEADYLGIVGRSADEGRPGLVRSLERA
jgi:hypothetical protein